MQSKKPDTTRSWRKIAVDWMLAASGWNAFVMALHQHYEKDNVLSKLIEDAPLAEDHSKSTSDLVPKFSLEQCFVNLALIQQEEYQRQEKTWISEKSSAVTFHREEIYQSLLNEGKTRGIDELFQQKAMINREETNWAFIVGQAGTGKTTLLQYISYRWGIGEALWNNRFEFVFRAKLNLVGQENFWNNIPDSSGIGRLAWLISHSLDITATPPFTFENIRMCLTKYPKQILLLLDGYDEVHSLYESDLALTSLIDKAMTFPNGILTARPKTIPASLLPRNNPQKLQRLELLGLTQDEVKQYVFNYFNEIAQPQLGQTLLTQLNCNPEMLGLAQIPVNISAICLTWQEEQKPITSMTMLYQRVVVCLARRYDKSFKLTAKEKRDGINPATILEETVLDRCKDELQILAKLAYDGFVRNEIQSLSDTLLKKHFPKDNPLLHRITTQFGMLRKSAIPIKKGEYPQHYFIHLTYQEYFAALYIAQQLAFEPQNNNLDEIKRRQTIHDLVYFIQTEKNNPHYAIIWRFLAGLLASPSYHLGANYFWNALIDIGTTHDDKTIIGLHPHIHILQNNELIIREALFNYTDHPKLKPPESLSILQEYIFQLTQWRHACQAKALLPIWDKGDTHKTTHYSRQNYHQHQQQYQSDKEVLKFKDIQPLSISIFLTFIPSWHTCLSMTRHQINNDGIYIPRAEAIFALGAVCANDEESLLELNKLYKITTNFDRVAAAEALASMGIIDNNELLKTLSWALKNGDQVTKVDVIEKIGIIGANDIKSIEALHGALKDKSGFVRIAAVCVLELINAITKKEALKVLREVLKNGDGNTILKMTATEAIEEINSSNEPSLKEICASLKDNDVFVRSDAANALGEIRDNNEESITALLETLKDSEAFVRCAAANALGKIGADDETLIKTLLEALHDNDTTVRFATANALGQIGYSSGLSLKILLEALQKGGSNANCAAETLKHIIFVLNDIPTICSLLKIADDISLDLKVMYDVHIALLRISPAVYAILPDLLSNATIQRFFIMSTWLHASTVAIKNNIISVDDSIITLNGTPEELQLFALKMHDFQTQFIQLTISSAEQLPQILHSLNKSIALPLSTLLPNFINLYEQELMPKKHCTEAQNIETLQHIMQEQKVSIENIHSLILNLINKNENQQYHNDGQFNPYAPEQHTYMKQFKQTLIEMHHIAFATSIGAIPLTPSNHANAASIILNIASNTIPVVGGGAKFLAYLIKFADTQLTKKRMENLKKLGSPDEIPATSNHISARLFYCRDLDNANETILSKLLSGSEDALDSYATNGYYGVLFGILDKSIEVQRKSVTIEERATQDAQYFIAAIAKNGVPSEKSGATIVNQLFLYAAPIPATMKALFLILLKKFCDTNHLIMKNVKPNGFKRNSFFGQVISSWHDKADAVSTCIERTETRDAFIEKLAENYASAQHLQGTGIFYLKPQTSSRISIYNSALTPKFSEEILNKTLSFS